jgi:hypothetical protein
VPAGAVGAGFFLALLSGSPGAVILVYLAQFPLFAAGLWLGAGTAVIAGLTGTAVVGVAGGAIAAALFAALYGAPAAFLVRCSLLARPRDGGTEWYPSGRLAAWLTGFGVAVAIAVTWLLGGPEGIRALLREALNPALTRFGGPSAAERNAFVDFFATIMPGVAAASWMVMTISNGILAQGVLARFGANWRPSPDLAALSLPPWIPALWPVAAVLAIFAGAPRFLGVNLLIVLAVPFCLAGLAVVHALARRLSRPAVPLALFYVLTALLGWPLFLVAILGAVDAVLGLRRRWVPASAVGRKREWSN